MSYMSEIISPQSWGGQIMAKRQKEAALARYYANPNYCKQCHKMIEPREGKQVSETRVKSFCDKHCSGLFNNKLGNPSRFKQGNQHAKKKPFNCKSCGEVIKHEDRSGKSRKHAECLYLKSKEYLIKRKCEVSRTSIAKHARIIAKPKGKACIICNYNKHVDACHIKPVSDFDDNISVKEINHPDNLTLLCKNCHWEFDTGILIINDFKSLTK